MVFFKRIVDSEQNVPQIATGASALMAIRVLVDHGVRPDHIIFAAFIVARNGGITTIQQAFPGVRVVTGSVDDKLVERVVEDGETSLRVWDIEPGMGHTGVFHCLHSSHTLH